jgi:hypothetical protein
MTPAIGRPGAEPRATARQAAQRVNVALRSTKALR